MAFTINHAEAIQILHKEIVPRGIYHIDLLWKILPSVMIEKLDDCVRLQANGRQVELGTSTSSEFGAQLAKLPEGGWMKKGNDDDICFYGLDFAYCLAELVTGHGPITLSRGTGRRYEEIIDFLEKNGASSTS